MGLRLGIVCAALVLGAARQAAVMRVSTPTEIAAAERHEQNTLDAVADHERGLVDRGVDQGREHFLTDADREDLRDEIC